MKAATLFGRPLPPRGTIGVPAPASAFENRSETLRGVEWWEARGYRVKLGDGRTFQWIQDQNNPNVAK